ncbi:MAG: fibronectin type III domain-containing protein [Candidatus Cryptobacteroides sp.]
MKLSRTIFFTVLASVCLLSCGQEKALDTFKGADFTFTGIAEELGGEPVEWSASAKVSVLDGVSNVLYQPLSSGVQPKFASRQGIDDNAMSVYAVSPYNVEHELVYGGVRAYLNPVYDVSDGVDGLRIACASEISRQEELHFMDAVSYLRVSLAEEEGVVSVTLSGLGGEVLAGLADVVMDEDGTPLVESVTRISKTVSLVSDGKALGGPYLIPLFPVVMESGCVLEFVNTDGLRAKAEKAGRTAFARNGVVDFGVIPDGLVWQKAPAAMVCGVSAYSLAFSWSETSWNDVAEDFAGKYTLGLYSDPECTAAVGTAEWDMDGAGVPGDLSRLVYTFSGLKPSTDYWFKVTDRLTNASSEVIAATTLDAGAVSYGPSVEVGTVFWSDGYIVWKSRFGEPDGYNVYVDGVRVNDTVLSADTDRYHLTGLSAGTEYSVTVAAVMGEYEEASIPVAVCTGALTANTANISPRSLSVAIENRAGGPANTVSPALYVELYKAGTDEALFSSIVVDGLATIAGQPFVTSLALSSARDRRPTNITFGRLEPSTEYRFRVKSFEKYTFRNRVSSVAGSDAEVSSPNGESEWSEFVTFSTPAEHSAEAGEVLFQGFDGCTLNQDFINMAVGTVPSYKAAGVGVGTLSYSALYSWGADNWAFLPLRMAHPSSQFAQYGWITGIGKSQTYPCTTGTGGSTVTAPEFIKGATAYKCNGNASPDLSDWYISNSAWPYQGYIGLGTDYTAADGATDDRLGFVISERLKKNLADAETVCTLTFKGLAMYGKAISVNVAKVGADGVWTEPLSVQLVNSAGMTAAADVWSVGDNHRWHEFSCEISLKKGDRVALATDKGGHALIDDIQIKVK